MQKITKTLSLSLAFFALAGLMMSFTPNQVYADPVPDGEVKVYAFNLIGRPNEFNGNCGEGNRMFVEADDKHAHVEVVGGDEWNVTDCNATGNNRGELTTDTTGTFNVYAVARGQPGTGIDICADLRTQHEEDLANNVDHLCLVGTFEIKRSTGKSHLKLVPAALFDTSLEDVIWSIDVFGQAKIRFIVTQVLNG